MSEVLHNLEAEMSVLGAMLLSDAAARDVALPATDFWRPAHRTIYRAMKRLVDARNAVDLVTLRDALAGELGEAGGEDYLMQIAEVVPSAANCAHYARIVADKAMLRRMEEAGHRVARLATDGEDER